MVQGGGHGQAHRAALRGAEVAAAAGQRAAGQEFQHDQAQPVDLVVVVDPHDVGMVEPGQGARLGGEPGHGHTLGAVDGHHFDRDRAAHSPVLPGQHQTERAPAQLGAHRVAGQRRDDLLPIDDHDVVGRVHRVLYVPIMVRSV
ncbi:hypothetical protein FsymDg_3279 [Candidatus Protofrankia datiscae]|uniref:Uncharacterized protein n=1 Tax=Candidatus Protofrankia datiscae TaxID=2716812 RepID=F8AZU4_9ACTN|nr:hypothetical protein FsymDg_3279 [Candidatus Protofrankia datiscae]